MRTYFLGLAALALAGCANAAAASRPVAAPTPAPAPAPIPETALTPVASPEPATPAVPAGPWIGASAESDVLMASGGESFVGVWVDVPASAHARSRLPVDLALVVDTSGSMEGEKIRSARSAAKTLVEHLSDGDIVSVDTFSDRASTLVPRTILSRETRPWVLSRIAELGATGSTNMFEGLQLAEMHVAEAPATHPARRIVMISDGQANVGPSSPEALASLAERSLRLGAQVSSLGVGLDYDERTLDAIAVRTTGRFFHIGDPREMSATLEHEVDLLAHTVASDATIEVVPAPGVQVLGVEGARMEWGGGEGTVRIPIGALFSGQHREALLRVRVAPGAAGVQRAIASVRLKFHDPSENNLERVQEVVAHAGTTTDSAEVASHANAKTHAMIAVLEAASAELQAAQNVGSGNFGVAQQQLARAEEKLDDEAARTKDVEAKKKIAAAKAAISSARASAAAAPSAPPPAVRADALEMNQRAMRMSGY